MIIEARDHVGPTSLLRGEDLDDHLKFSSEITLRYSDAPKPMNQLS